MIFDAEVPESESPEDETLARRISALLSSDIYS